ncbi:HIT-like protein [Mycena olivaceomarginata]|nr:HIT-like protein [Mycena olivaceomarginata]
MTSFLIKAHENRAQSSWNGYKDCAFCRIIKDELPSFRVFENDLVVAVLAVGLAVTKVAHALTQALDNTALNVVCNQEYAQAVPHVHYHVIPAPTFGKQPSTPVGKGHRTPYHEEMHQREFDGRTELDEEEGEILAKQIRSKL